MYNCSKCKQNKQPSVLPPKVLEIVNPEQPVLFHKVKFPASIGDDKEYPADTLNYKNVLLTYEANNHSYLYSSDGVSTFISLGAVDTEEIMKLLQEHGIEIKDLQTGVTELQEQVGTLQDDLETEAHARIQGDTNLSNQITAEENARTDADNQLQSSIDTTKQELDGLSNLVNEISDELGSSQDDITQLQTQVTANSADISSLKTEVATAQDNIAANTSNIDTNTSAIDAINANLNQDVEYSTAFTANDSTVTVQHGKVNLNTNEKSSTSEALPVASTANAGVMNAATFNAVQDNTQTAQALLSGAVAIQDVPATPTQEELTALWKAATGIDTLINRASIFDVANNKIWTYYTNDSTWHATGTTGGVAVSQATNTSLGIVKGSTQAGQNYAEEDGTLSVNGWDATQANISTLQSTVAEQGTLLNTTAAQLEDAQTDINNALGDITAIQADYVSKTKIVQRYSTATDEINSAAFINTKLNSYKVEIGDNANANDYVTIVIGSDAASTGGGLAIGIASSATINSTVLGNNAKTNSTDSTVIGKGASTTADANSSVALGARAKATRPYELSIGDSSADEGKRFRFVANVKAGELDTDAVNVAQLKEVSQAVSDLQTLVSGAVDELTRLDTGTGVNINES